MKKQFVIWGVALLTVINIVSLATIGYHRFGDRREHRSERRQSFEQELGLSTVQIEQREAIRKTLKERIKPLQEDLRAKRERLYQSLMATESDRMQIDSIRTEITSLEAKIGEHFVDYILAHKEILTPEQQETFFSMMQKRYRNGYRRR